MAAAAAMAAVEGGGRSRLAMVGSVTDEGSARAAGAEYRKPG